MTGRRPAGAQLRRSMLWATLWTLGGCAAPRPTVTPDSAPPKAPAASATSTPRGPAAPPARVPAELPPHAVTLDGLPGSPRVQVPALSPPRVSRGGGGGALLYAAVDFGLEVECAVRPDRMDLGGVLRVAVGQYARGMAAEGRVLAVQRVLAGAVPVVLTGVDRGAAEDDACIRVAAANVGDRAVVCSLASRLREAELRHVVDGLVASLAEAAPPEAAREYHWVDRSDGRVGVAERVLKRRADGVTLDVGFSSTVRVVQGGLQSVDDVSVEVTDAEATVMMWRVLRTENGRLTRDVQVSPGPRQGRMVLRRGDAPPVDLGGLLPTSARTLRGWLVAAQQGVPVPHAPALRFFPGVDDENLAEETVTHLGPSPEGEGARFASHVVTPARTVEAQYTVDAQGSVLHSVVQWSGGRVELRAARPPAGRRGASPPPEVDDPLEGRPVREEAFP